MVETMAEAFEFTFKLLEQSKLKEEVNNCEEIQSLMPEF